MELIDERYKTIVVEFKIGNEVETIGCNCLEPVAMDYFIKQD
jgi:hypothetical protein